MSTSAISSAASTMSERLLAPRDSCLLLTIGLAIVVAVVVLAVALFAGAAATLVVVVVAVVAVVVAAAAVTATGGLRTDPNVLALFDTSALPNVDRGALLGTAVSADTPVIDADRLGVGDITDVPARNMLGVITGRCAAALAIDCESAFVVIAVVIGTMGAVAAAVADVVAVDVAACAPLTELERSLRASLGGEISADTVSSLLLLMSVALLNRFAGPGSRVSMPPLDMRCCDAVRL
jgi:hypothetical protein